MSEFLANIHYWLYKKIRIVVEREDLIYTNCEQKLGPEVDEIRQQVWQIYGEPLPDVDLAELIDKSNIHSWLKRQINLAEIREAVFIKKLIELYGDEAKEVIENAFVEHGTICGINARQSNKYNVLQVGEAYKALNDYLLNGMPCDQVNRIVENTSNRIIWEDKVIKENNWIRAGVDQEFIKKLYQNWIANFIKSLNPSFYYRQITNTPADDNLNRHEIVAK